MSRPRYLIVLIASLVVSLPGCAPIDPQTSPDLALPQGNHVARSASTAGECRELINQQHDPFAAALDATDIRLLNWNIKKGQQAGWRADLRQLADDAQLILIQEAAFDSGMRNAGRLASFWSFAPGYKAREVQTGVLTASSVEPVTHCNLTAWEPWLGTPKATSITEYSLKDSDQTLVVVNIHALNFTLGVKGYAAQMAEIQEALQDHTGPIILSGDFNSWRSAREKHLQQLVNRLQMSSLPFEVDQRVQVFGRPIDHIYVRGLQVLTSSADSVNSSDHNPMRASLALLK